ncbi:MAG: serpin family protein [Clostridium sp.]
MFKNKFKDANNEIKAPEPLKTSTLNKLLEASNHSSRKTNKIFNGKPWIPAGITTIGLTAALALILSLNGTIAPYFNHRTNTPTGNDTTNEITPAVVYALGKPEYPSTLAFDDYQGRNSRLEDINANFLQGVRDFSFTSADSILNTEDTSNNSVYSPLSLYMALALLAETTEGSTREEILNLLSINDMNLISNETPKLFRSLYIDNEIGKLNLANSLWLSNTYDFKKDTIDKLTSNYYAHSFSVDFGDAETSKSISDWISTNTGGKLGTDPSAFKPDPSQIISIINTIYFYDQWQNKFDPELTKADEFKLSDGTTVSADFMNTQAIQSFSKGNNYTSSSLSFKNQCSMVFILPDEGVSPYDIVNNPAALAKAVNYVGTPYEKYGQVTFKIPKFKFTNDLELTHAIKALGVEEIFSSNADFSPLTDNKGLFVSQVNQSATIAIDEIGCEAAAFTEILICGSGPSTDKADMILNSPFIFAIKDSKGIPLFIGVINNPLK